MMPTSTRTAQAQRHAHAWRTQRISRMWHTWDRNSYKALCIVGPGVRVIDPAPAVAGGHA
jgi:hypothetical protein